MYDTPTQAVFKVTRHLFIYCCYYDNCSLFLVLFLTVGQNGRVPSKHEMIPKYFEMQCRAIIHEIIARFASRRDNNYCCKSINVIT